MIPKKNYSSNSKGIIHPSFDFKWKDLITIQLQQNHLSEGESLVEEDNINSNDELPPYPPFTDPSNQLELLSNQSNQVMLYLQMNLQLPSTKQEINSDVIRLYEEVVNALHESQLVIKGISNSNTSNYCL
ncbi:hypothetical protein MP638_005672 [Amoeboaphelidium occidentale]|nr:hypothetical protein MP638_005672 [Amoeboaphelidium occidentale]